MLKMKYLKNRQISWLFSSCHIFIFYKNVLFIHAYKDKTYFIHSYLQYLVKQLCSCSRHSEETGLTIWNGCGIVGRTVLPDCLLTRVVTKFRNARFWRKFVNISLKFVTHAKFLCKIMYEILRKFGFAKFVTTLLLTNRRWYL
jgi:hypothetical protein